jgi:hypothetical protein
MTNDCMLQMYIASFLFAPTSRHNDKLRCESLLIAHFDHLNPPPPNHLIFVCSENYNIVTIFWINVLYKTLTKCLWV